MGKLTISWKQIYVFCIFMWSFMYTIINESYIELPYEVYAYTWIIVRILLISKILICERKNVRSLILGILILLFGIISRQYSNNSFLEPFFWFLAAANNIEIRKIVKSIFFAQLLAFILITSLSFLGIIDNYQLVRDSTSQIRHSLGFNHPNTAALKAFQISMMYIYLIRNKLRLRYCAIILMFELFVYKYTNSNTSFYLTLLLISLLIVYLISNKRIRFLSGASVWVIKLLKYVSILSVGFSLYMTLNYPSSSGLIDMFESNSTVLSRFSQMYIYFRTYNITPFGQELYYHGSGNIISDNVTGMYTLDNAYIYLLLGLGIVAFILFFILYICAIYKSIKENDLIVLILISIYLILGLSETAMIRFTYNFTLVFLFGIIWKGNLSGIRSLDT